MKLKKLLATALIAMTMYGCINDERIDCALENNTVILFEYSALSTQFNDVISSVDVVLFDGEGRFFLHRRIEDPDLRLYQGTRFTLDPGTYYVVSWANVSYKSAFRAFEENTTSFDECLLEIDSSSTESGGDPIYYAPAKAKPACRSGAGITRASDDLSIYEIIVPVGERVTKTLDFVRAHRTINVWINGYTENSVAVNPTVGATKLWSGYNFYFSPTSTRRDFSQKSQTATLSGTTYSSATFHSAMGTIDANTDIIVKNSNGAGTIYSVNLRDFIDENNIADEDTDEIDILITFTDDLGVTVGLPDWSDKPVKPGVH